MRHAGIDTTMAYYVDLDLADLTDQLWATFGNTKPGKVKKPETTADDVSTEAVGDSGLTSGGHGTRTHNPVTVAPHFQRNEKRYTYKLFDAFSASYGV